MNLDSIADLFIEVDRLADSTVLSNNVLSQNVNEEILTGILGTLTSLNMEVGTDRFITYEGTVFRAHLGCTKTGKQYALRRVPSFIPSLDKGNKEGIEFPSYFPSIVQKQLKKPGGLYLVSGPLGSGKTTTVAALLNYMLTLTGGVARTLEDPPEYDLQGKYGDNGICWQHVVEGGDFAPLIRNMMRSFPSGMPSYMLLGEIRDQNTAQEALRAMLNGTSVLATIHGEDIQSSVLRFINLCGNGAYVRESLGKMLRLLINQHKAVTLSGASEVKFTVLEGGNDLNAILSQEKTHSIRDLVILQNNARIGEFRGK